MTGEEVAGRARTCLRELEARRVQALAGKGGSVDGVSQQPSPECGGSHRGVLREWREPEEALARPQACLPGSTRRLGGVCG